MALYVRECFSVVELGAGNDQVESLWVSIRGRANTATILVGVYCRLPNQNGETDEGFYEQLAEMVQSPALVLMGDFSVPGLCWKVSTVHKQQPQRFLECVESECFVAQLVKEPTEDVLL